MVFGFFGPQCLSLIFCGVFFQLLLLKKHLANLSMNYMQVIYLEYSEW